MKIEQNLWTPKEGWSSRGSFELKNKVQLVFVFASTSLLKEKGKFMQIREMYPNANIIGCSTAGEIYSTNVLDDTIAVTAIYFENTKVVGSMVGINSMEDSYKTGEKLAKSLEKEGLIHAFVLSDGLNVNGSKLVEGLKNAMPKDISITGGLAGDGGNFKETAVLWNDIGKKNSISIIGFYGDKLKVGFGSLGGWDTFGHQRLITKSKDNILYELDGKSALDLYKQYLGNHAKELPASALLYPLSVAIKDSSSIVRTILAVDDKEKSMTFAGDVPEGTYAQFMKANFDRLIDGAIGAAEISKNTLRDSNPDLAILISCVGRKMILKQRIEEEVEGVKDALGEKTFLTGFYSYGEISPFSSNTDCELHNQTMTITAFSER